MNNQTVMAYSTQSSKKRFSAEEDLEGLEYLVFNSFMNLTMSSVRPIHEFDPSFFLT